MKTRYQDMALVLLMVVICGTISFLATMELRKEKELQHQEIIGLKKELETCQKSK